MTPINPRATPEASDEPAHDSIADAVADLGRSEEIGEVFVRFQKYLYAVA